MTQAHGILQNANVALGTTDEVVALRLHRWAG